MATSAAALNVGGRALKHHNLLLVIKQTAFEEYSQVSGVLVVFEMVVIGKDGSLTRKVAFVYAAEIEGPSSKGSEVEASRKTIQGTQAMCQ